MNWQMTKERAELGSKRCFYSMRIHEALRRNGRSAAVVAYEIGVSREAVSATILGKNHSERVLNALRSAGVPEKYLFDPRYPERWAEKDDGGIAEKINQKLIEEAVA